MVIFKDFFVKILICSLFSLVVFANNSFAKIKASPYQNRKVTFKIKLKGNAVISIEKAPLKYDKKIAFSFTLDDGYRSAFLCAYPLLNGGKISPSFIDEWQKDQGGDGSESSGLFFSDGCGNVVPFRMSVAINAVSIRETPVNRGSLSWAEVKKLYDAGWDILSHGYRHSTKHGTDYMDEVRQNGIAVEKKLEFKMTQFVVPGGEADPGYEHEYEKAAFNNGLLAVGSTNGAGPVIVVDKPVNLNRLVYQREFVRSTANTGFADIDKRLLKIESLLKRSERLWYNEFSHGVGNDNLWDLSLTFPDFKYYMNSIGKKYGIKGTDNLWMAPWQEVYEYIWLRDRTEVSIKQTGTDVLVGLLLPSLPETIRHRTISLNVGNASTFEVLSQSKDIKITTNGSNKHNLINIHLIN